MVFAGTKGGVGKTTTAAHVWDKMERVYASIRAFDFEPGVGVGFSRFCKKAQKMEMGDPENRRDLNVLVNDLQVSNPNRPIVALADMPANATEQFLHWAQNIPWDELAKQKIRLVLCLVISRDSDSFALAQNWIKQLGNRVRFVVILNEGLGKDFRAYTHSQEGIEFAETYKPLQIVFPAITESIMCHVRNEGSTLFRAIEEQTGIVTFLYRVLK